jgi:hypothetical protein
MARAGAAAPDASRAWPAAGGGSAPRKGNTGLAGGREASGALEAPGLEGQGKPAIR